MNAAFFWGLIASSSLLIGGLRGLKLSIGKRALGAIMAFGAGTPISTVANAADDSDTETVVVQEPTYAYHVDPVPAAPAPASGSAQSRLAEAKSSVNLLSTWTR